MEVSLTGAEGLPSKAVISIRVGQTRRQAPFKINEVFQFPTSGASSVVLDVFEKVGSTHVSLAGIKEINCGTQQQDVSLTSSTGSKMSIGLKVQCVGADKAAMKPVAANASEQRTASTAKSYLETYGVQDLLQKMVHSLLASQPVDPLAFMSSFIEEAKTAAKAVAPAAPPVAARPGFGEEDYPGFPTEVCPAELPDLSGHFSLMAEALQGSPHLYGLLRSLRTKDGVSLARIIKPGMDNKGHRMIKSMGLVAGDEHCFHTFRPLFDAVVALRYGVRWTVASSVHPTSMDPMQVSKESMDTSGRYVDSVQVRIGRNLSGLRFPPACSKEERREAERLLVGALLELNGGIAGSYYPIAGSQSFVAQPGGMSEADEAKLKEQCAFFWKPDSTLALAAGLGRQWPDARGIFTSSQGDLWAWMNEEDHLRLFSAQNGSNLQEAFARLCRAESSMQSRLKQAGYDWAHSKRLGFLATSPANLGTSLCATAFMRLPQISQQAKFRSLCKSLHLQAQRSGTSGLWAISNSERLGSSEVDQVNCVITGCRILIETEMQLEGGSTMPMTMPSTVVSAATMPAISLGRRSKSALVSFDEIPGLGVEEYPGFPTEACPPKLPNLSAHFNLAAEVLRKDPLLYDKLMGRRTKSGVSFAKVIKPSMDTKGHPMIKTVGAVAGDDESYTAFRELFDPIITLCHGNFSGSACHRTMLDPSKVNATPIDPAGTYLLSTRITVARNLCGFRLPSAASFDERREIERVLSGVLLELSGVFEGDYYPLPSSGSCPGKPHGMSKEEEERLARAGALFMEPDSALLLSSGMGRSWPDARGVFANDAMDFIARINEEDHLTLMVSQPGARVQEAFAGLCRVHAVLEAALSQQGRSFMHSDRLGFLTSCPSNLGSAIRAVISVRFPLLSARQDFKETCRELRLKARPADANEPDVWELSSAEGSLGTSEAALVSCVVRGCCHLVEMEEALAHGLPVRQPSASAAPPPG